MLQIALEKKKYDVGVKKQELVKRKLELIMGIS